MLIKGGESPTPGVIYIHGLHLMLLLNSKNKLRGSDMQGQAFMAAPGGGM